MAGFADRVWGGTALLAFGAVSIGGVAHVYAEIVKAPYPFHVVVVILGAFLVSLIGSLAFCDALAWGGRRLKRLWRLLCGPRCRVPTIGLILLAASAAYLWFALSDYAKTWWGYAVLALGAWGLLFLVPRYLHLWAAFIRHVRNGSVWRGQPTPVPPAFEQVLPSQRGVIEDLLQATGLDMDRPLSPQARTVALKASWGMGKTACLRAFEHRVMAPCSKSGVVAWFDCWRHQADPQPEFSIYWEMAQTWRMLWPWGWLFVPALRIYLTLLPVIAKATLDIGKAKLELDDKALREVPRALFWQRHLEALVSLAAVRHGRVVLVLEDIDRCTVPAAQAYVTLIRRFLSVPGLTTVVPFVEEQFRPKVFHPLCGQLPDLAATTDAVLWQWYSHTLTTVQDSAGVTASPMEAALAAYGPKKPDDKAGDKEKGSQKAGDKEKGSEKAGDKDKASDNIMQMLRPALLRQFTRAGSHERQRIFAFLEDKYLYDHVLRVPELEPDDFAHLTAEALTKRPEWGAIIPGGNGAEGGAWEQVRAVVGQHFGNVVLPPPGAPRPPVTPRQFNGALSQILQEAGAHLPVLQEEVEQALPNEPAAGRLAALVAHMAYDLAATRTRLSNPGDAL